MTNYISFSLFGSAPIYTSGLIRNLEIAPSIYPDWAVVVFVDDHVPESTISRIGELGGRALRPSGNPGLDKRTWRFGAVFLEDAEAVIFRDSDSRINERERSCVQQWMDSGKDLHIMRDHPFHSWWIMAGMWGVRAGAVKSAIREVLTRSKGFSNNEDQDLLASAVYPKLASSSVVHDSFFRRESWAVPFPVSRKNGSFVGERITSLEEPEPTMREVLVKYESSRYWQCRLLVRDYLRTRFEQRL